MSNKYTCRAFFFSVLLTIFSYASFGNYWLGHWQNKWAIGLGVLVVWWALTLRVKWGWAVAACVCVPLLSSIYVGLFEPSQYAGIPVDELLNIKFLSVSSALMFGVMVLFFLRLTPTHAYLMGKAFALACYIESLWVVGAFIYGVESLNRGGLLGNASMAGSFIACTYPFTWKYDLLPWSLRMSESKQAWIWLAKRFLPLVAVCLLGASQPILLFVFVSLCMVASKIKEVHGNIGWKDVALTVGAVSWLPLLVLYFLVDNPEDRFFNDTGRLDMLELGSYAFREKLSWWFGAGLGTTAAWLPELQVQAHMANNPGHKFATLSMWFHNDWFQVLFELGVFGFLSFVALYKQCVSSAWGRDIFIFSSVCGYGVMALLNYPVHLYPTALLGFYLVWSSLTLDSEKQVS